MATKILSVTADVSISEKYSYNAYNQANRLAFGVGSSGDRYWALLKFGSLGIDDAAYEITAATLTVNKIDGALGSQSGFGSRAVQLTGAWTEATTWDTKPTYDTVTQSPVVATGEGHSGALQYDVTAIVQAWASGKSQNGIMLIPTVSSGTLIKTIADRTASGAASISVTYAAREPKPSTPSVSGLGTITTDAANIKWTASSDHIYASSELKYEVQVSLNDGASWISVGTTAAAVTQLTINVADLAGVADGQFYRSNIKVRVRAVTPAYNGTVYYSAYGSASGVVDYRVSPSVPANVDPDTRDVYEGQGFVVTVSRPTAYNTIDASGKTMMLTYMVYLGGTMSGVLTAPATQESVSVECTAANVTTGKNNATAQLSASVADAEGQVSASASAGSMTVKRYRNPILTASVYQRTNDEAVVALSISDTGYAVPQSADQIAGAEYSLNGGSEWVTAELAGINGLKASIPIPAAEDMRVEALVRVSNVAPEGLEPRSSETVPVTILEYLPTAFVFRDTEDGSQGLYTRGLIVGPDPSVAQGNGAYFDVPARFAAGLEWTGRTGLIGVGTFTGDIDDADALPPNTVAWLTPSTPATGGGYAFLVTYGYNKTGRLQMYTNFSSGTRKWRMYGNGEWTDWAWDNPPLVQGVEYMTSRRYGSYPIYTKRISFGSLPNNTSRSINHGIAMTRAVGVWGVDSSGAVLPRAECQLSLSQQTLSVTATTDLSARTASIVLEYTKD